MSNRATYRRPEIVDAYLNLNGLQLPEIGILDQLKDKLPEMNMLDIGIGGGRTTFHMAKLPKSYVGIDYTKEMVDACKKRFHDFPKSVSFRTCDARKMDIFPDNTFDVILFSFNAIDNNSHADRMKAYEEIRRVGKPDAYFWFSSHNLLSFRQQFSFHHPKNALRWFWHNHYFNLDKLKHAPYAILNDGVHDYGLRQYFVNPLEQIRQLYEGDKFRNVKVFSVKDGREIEEYLELESNREVWLYYLCNIHKEPD